MHQQRPLSRWADARHLVQCRGRQAFRALGAVRADGEAMRLVPQPLKVEKQGRIGLQRDFATARQVEYLPALAAMMRSLGDAHDWYVTNPLLLHDIQSGIELPLAAIDQHKVRPCALLAIRVFLAQTGKAPRQDFLHHAEIIVGSRRLNVELAIIVFPETLRPGDDHRPGRGAPHDMAVVVNFDPVRRPFELECFSQLTQQFRLRRAFGHAPLQCFDRIALRLLDQLAL